MDSQQAFHLGQQGLYMLLLVSAPILLAVLVVATLRRPVYGVLGWVLFGRRATGRQLIALAVSYAGVLLEASLFMPNQLLQQEAIDLVARKSGRPTRDLDALSMWLWSIDTPPYPALSEFKARLYERLDPRFREHFDQQPALLN